MENIIVKKLEEQIERLFIELSITNPGTEEYDVIVESINKLYGTLHKEKELVLNEYKIDVEAIKVANDRVAKSEENMLQLKTLKDSKIWNGVKTVVEIGTISAPLICYGIWFNRGLKFEETGTFVSPTFKGLIGKFKPTR